jgi:hypothetical protein
VSLLILLGMLLGVVFVCQPIVLWCFDYYIMFGLKHFHRALILFSFWNFIFSLKDNLHMVDFCVLKEFWIVIYQLYQVYQV